MIDNFNQEEFFIMCGDFSDDFNYEPSYSKIKDEPLNYGDLCSWQKTYIAAMVEYLAETNKVQKPDWVFNERYTLEIPVFIPEPKTEKQNWIMLLSSPKEAKQRRLFIPSNSFYRC